MIAEWTAIKVTNVGEFNAAKQALKASGAFLTEQLGGTAR